MSAARSRPKSMACHAWRDGAGALFDIQPASTDGNEAKRVNMLKEFFLKDESIARIVRSGSSKIDAHLQLSLEWKSFATKMLTICSWLKADRRILDLCHSRNNLILRCRRSKLDLDHTRLDVAIDARPHQPVRSVHS